MKKQIVLICEGSQQFGLMVEELSIHKVVGAIITDLSNPIIPFINLVSYLPDEDPDQVMYVKTSIVKAVVVANVSNIQTPNKGILVPGMKPN